MTGDPRYSDTACPFCMTATRPVDATATLGCPLWRCPCTAIGVGASPMDIDEALDELEATIGLPRGILGGPTPAPVGTSGMVYGTYIDPPAMVAAAITSAPPGWRVGSSTATVELSNGRRWEQLVIWARASDPSPS